MKHLLNDLSSEEKNRIREQYEGGMSVDISKFKNLLESKLGEVKPLVNEEETVKESGPFNMISFLNKNFTPDNGWYFELDEDGIFDWFVDGERVFTYETHDGFNNRLTVWMPVWDALEDKVGKGEWKKPLIKWKKPLIKWFENNTGLTVDTVEKEIEGDIGVNYLRESSGSEHNPSFRINESNVTRIDRRIIKK